MFSVWDVPLWVLKNVVEGAEFLTTSRAIAEIVDTLLNCTCNSTCSSLRLKTTPMKTLVFLLIQFFH